MEISGIDPRIESTIVSKPVYRVCFFDANHSSDEHRLTGAVSCLSVIEWAIKAAEGRTWVVYVEHGEPGETTALRLVGSDRREADRRVAATASPPRRDVDQNAKRVDDPEVTRPEAKEMAVAVRVAAQPAMPVHNGTPRRVADGSLERTGIPRRALGYAE